MKRQRPKVLWSSGFRSGISRKNLRDLKDAHGIWEQLDIFRGSGCECIWMMLHDKWPGSPVSKSVIFLFLFLFLRKQIQNPDYFTNYKDMQARSIKFFSNCSQFCLSGLIAQQNRTNLREDVFDGLAALLAVLVEWVVNINRLTNVPCCTCVVETPRLLPLHSFDRHHPFLSWPCSDESILSSQRTGF